MPTLAWRSDVDGFAFSNSWSLDATERATLAGMAPAVVPAAVAAVGLVIPDPITLAILTGTLTVAAQGYLAVGPSPAIGLCGGMAYASLDHWRARSPLPRGAHSGDQPARTGGAATTLRNLTWQRLIDSLTFGGVLQRTLEWSLLLNQIPPVLGGGAGRLLRDTQTEWGILKAHIDAGQPWPIGLIYSGRSVWDQHQVLAYGYEDMGDGTGLVRVYDSNVPHQYGDTTDSIMTLDFRGSSLVATSPSDGPGTVCGFFCSNYSFAAPPPGLAAGYGQFLRWNNDPRTFMVTEGARLPVADPAELAALGATPADVRMPGVGLPAPLRPRNGALLRERSAAPVFLYAGGAPFQIPDPNWLMWFGGWEAVRVVPDGTLAAFAGLPDPGTLLREWSDARVYVVEGGQRQWVRTGAGLAQRGGGTAVRVVPDGALAAIPEGPAIPPVRPSAIVPEVRGQSRRDADKAVRAAGFNPLFIGRGGPLAEVASQTPNAGASAEQGTSVRMRLLVDDL
jgi:PASTA domain